MEKTFETEVLKRLAVIESKLDNYQKIRQFAELLGIEKSTLYRKLRKYDIYIGSKSWKGSINGTDRNEELFELYDKYGITINYCRTGTNLKCVCSDNGTYPIKKGFFKAFFDWYKTCDKYLYKRVYKYVC